MKKLVNNYVSEWELLELKLFLSSASKEHRDYATKSLKKLRKMEAEGKIDLKQFEDLANDF